APKSGVGVETRGVGGGGTKSFGCQLSLHSTAFCKAPPGRKNSTVVSREYARRWRGQQPGQTRSCHLAARPCSNLPVRPAGVRAALGLPSGSLVLETETQRRQTGTLSKSRAAGERQIGATLSCSCLGYTVGDAELVLEPGERGTGPTNLQPTQVTKYLWPSKAAATRTGLALQIQCYQCEEFQLNNDCSSPEFIVNCTVNVQDMCQKEVMEQSA
ncbi:hypothetical protein A6R68_00933, partial [Neotoma lepida]